MSNDVSPQARSAGAPVGPLAAALASTMEAVDDPARLFEALVALEPTAALRWLSEHASAARTGIPEARLTAACALALDGLPGNKLSEQDLARAVAGLAAVELYPAGALARLLARTPPERVTDSLEQLLGRALDREPGHAGLLRAAAVHAVHRRESARAHALLSRLGTADPTPGTLAFVRNARASLDPAPGTSVRIALLSSYTIDPLLAYVDHECRKLGLVPEIYLAPFNTWGRELIDPGSALHNFRPDVTFLSVAIDDLVPALAGAPDVEALSAAGDDAVRTIMDAAHQFAGRSGKPIVVHGFHSAFRGPQGTLEGSLGPSRAQWLAEVNGRLAETLRARPGCFFLDIQDLLLREGGCPDQPKLRHLASMRLPGPALGAVARAYARYIAPQKGLVRKCVVVDLDNTLWGGVIGEDGMAGIRLGHTSPGSEYVELQHYLATLRQRGFLLAINSKNNPDDALEVLRTHEAMILREPAFSAMRINWRPKPENMVALAEELNLGLDSFVFVDDNPDERELMRQLLPEVLTVELPRDPSRWRGILEQLAQLQTLSVTDEDRSRSAQYAANRQREQVRISTASLDEYLRSLSIRVAIGPVTDAVLPRVAQLYQRTNQFNVTTRRYDVGDLRRFVEDAGRRLYALRAGDRFGDHGLVATAMVRTASEEWTVDSFLMSCRVIGYGIETALLAHIGAEACAAGASRLAGEFIATKKNAPARDIYSRHGFTGAGASEGVERWTLDLTTAAPVFPHWIERTEHGP